jgi:phosphatidylinositol-3-phosphatase
MFRKIVSLAAAALLLVLASCSSGPSSPTLVTDNTALPAPTGLSSGLPNFKHIFILLMENQESGDVIGNASAPYINRLAHQYGMAARYYGISHPSLPNYLELLGGSTFGISSDCTDCFVNAVNLVDQVERAHKSWKAYMEGMPSPCFVGDAGDYAQRHNPFIYFDDIRTNPTRCANIVPLGALNANALPDLVWITPNLCHDMHDCDVSTGDRWLQGFLPRILNSAAWPGSALFLLWDEGSSDAGCCQVAQGGHIPMLMLSSPGKPGYVSQVEYDHASVLRTIEDAWGLGRLRDAACACTNALSDLFAG